MKFERKKMLLLAVLCLMTYLILMLLPRSKIPIRNLINRSGNFDELNKDKQNILPSSTVRELMQCIDRSRVKSIEEAGNFIILYNLVMSEKTFSCHESVTFSTQGDYSFLNNIAPLVQRWQGPVSVALYAPGDDFKPTLDSIAYVRSCYIDLIRELVSFHVYFDRRHPPKLGNSIVQYIESYNWTWNCSIKPPFETISTNAKYRIKKKMEFYINVGRNIAIREAHTHFLLSADLELYPSLNVIPRFFEMLVRDHEMLETFSKKVYVLPVFESAIKYPSPKNKSELQDLFKLEKALFFAGKLCPDCHNFPKKAEWLAAKDNGQFTIFSNTSRQGKYKRWEPVYIGTHAEPLFQERVTWDGGSDKMVKDFVMCLLEYKLLVLDNAFIVHKPGFKKPATQIMSNKKNMTKIILKEIVPELVALYGKTAGCVIGGQFSKNVPNYH